MDKVSIIGLDISKRSFQVHGATADGAPVVRRKLTRAKVLEFLASQPRCLVVMETCGGAHHWGREIQQLGHEVRLIAPIYVKAFAKRQKSVRRARPCEAIAHRRSLDGGRASKCPSTIGGHEGACRMAGRHRMRRRWSQEEKRRIVAQTLMPGASVSQVARRYDVNTNLVFTWRRDPRLRPAVVPECEPTFLPVEVVSSPVPEPVAAETTIEVALCNGHRVSVSGSFDVEALCRLVHGLAR